MTFGKTVLTSLATTALMAAQTATSLPVITQVEVTEDNVVVSFYNDGSHPDDALVNGYWMIRKPASEPTCEGGPSTVVALSLLEPITEYDSNGDPSGFTLTDPLLDANGDPSAPGDYKYCISGSIPLTTWPFIRFSPMGAPSSTASVTPLEPRPRAPAIDRNVHLVTNADLETAHVPPHSTSSDGRIALRTKSGGNLFFMLFEPEKLGGPVLHEAPGMPLLSGPTKTVPIASFYGPPLSNASGSMSTLCDPNETPVPCAGDPTKDCYDLTAIVYIQGDAFWGTPIRVEVSNPKTSSAQIDSVTPTGPPVRGYSFGLVQIPEPAVTRDGRLLVGRGSFELDWDNDQTIEKFSIFYSVYPEEEGGVPTPPCDVTRWTDVKPISHAPHDDAMKDSLGNPRYGIAAFPFRDTEGSLITEGEDLRASYPWIDRDGDNLFFTTIRQRLHYWERDAASTEGYRLRTRYPSRCLDSIGEAACPVPASLCQEAATDINCPVSLDDVNGSNAPYLEAGDATRGITMLGLWTRGKMVLLDERINNTDYGMSSREYAHRMLTLYRDATAQDTETQVGTGRDNIWDDPGFGMWEDETAINSTMLGSLQHLFHFSEDLEPRTPRDLVWLFNTGKVSAEIAFDDFVDRSLLIYADMNASLSWDSDDTPYRGIHHRDGFQHYPDKVAGIKAEHEGLGMIGEVRLQNAATIETPAPPPYGETLGAVRVEPVALGGIVGKGLWLDGTAAASFEIQDDLSTSDTYTSLFVDARQPGTASRRLVTYPDGSYVALRASELVLVSADGEAWVVDLESGGYDRLHDTGYNHLAWTAILDEGDTHVDIYVNGYLFETQEVPGESFRLEQGPLTVGFAGVLQDPIAGYAGYGALGFRGWVDELRVGTAVPDPETLCNQARGTLVRVETGTPTTWDDWAAGFTNGHTLIGSLLSSGKYFCHHDYSTDDALPVETASSVGTPVGSAIRFPEGPLVWDEARPDGSYANPVCLGCHASNEPMGLGLDALTFTSGLTMHDDPRRQPSQAPATLTGNIPADMVGLGNLEEDATPAAPFNLDAWVHP